MINFYNICGYRLEVVDFVKYFGVIIYKNFRWNEYIDNIMKKVNFIRVFI